MSFHICFSVHQKCKCYWLLATYGTMDWGPQNIVDVSVWGLLCTFFLVCFTEKKAKFRRGLFAFSSQSEGPVCVYSACWSGHPIGILPIQISWKCKCYFHKLSKNECICPLPGGMQFHLLKSIKALQWGGGRGSNLHPLLLTKHR